MKRLLYLSYLLIVGLTCPVLFSCSDDEATPPDLTITSIEPLTARADDTIRMQGTGFSEKRYENEIYFGSQLAKVITATPNELAILVPPAATDGPVRIVIRERTATSEQSFVFDPRLGAPILTSISPEHALPGSTVTITGKNLVEGAVIADIFFGSQKATVVNATETKMTVTVPRNLPEGMVNVKALRAGYSSGILSFLIDPLPKQVKPMFWTDGYSLYKGTMTDEGPVIETIYDMDDKLSTVYGIAYNEADNMLYFVGSLYDSEGMLFRAPANGNGPIEELYTYTGLDEGFPAVDIALDPANHTLYTAVITNNGEDQIIRANYADLSAPIEVLYQVNTGGGDITGIKLDLASGKIYWAEAISKRIMQGSMDGTAAATVLFDSSDGLQVPYNLAFDVVEQKLFILDSEANFGSGSGAIWSGNLTGTGSLTKIISEGDNFKSGSFDIEVDTDNQVIIWPKLSASGPPTDIKQSSYDGSDVKTTFSIPPFPGWMYFALDKSSGN